MRAGSSMSGFSRNIFLSLRCRSVSSSTIKMPENVGRTDMEYFKGRLVNEFEARFCLNNQADIECRVLYQVWASTLDTMTRQVGLIDMENSTLAQCKTKTITPWIDSKITLLPHRSILEYLARAFNRHRPGRKLTVSVVLLQVLRECCRQR